MLWNLNLWTHLNVNLDFNVFIWEVFVIYFQNADVKKELAQSKHAQEEVKEQLQVKLLFLF